MIPVQITQTQEENDNPTMSLPFLERKLLQSTLWAKKEDAPAPEPDFIQVDAHKRGYTKVQGYKKYPTPAQTHGNKKKGKALKSKTNTKQGKLTIFYKANPAECKASVQLAECLRIKYLKELVNSF